MIDIDKLTEEQLASAEADFNDRQAARMLADEERQSERSGQGVSFATLQELAQNGRPLAEAFAGKPIPFNAIQLYRTLLQRRSLGYSLGAKAASTEEIAARDVGPYRFEIELDDDAAFLMIHIGKAELPQVITFLRDDGRQELLSLPKPVEGVVQVGLSRHEQQWRSLQELLASPETAIYIF